MLRLRGTSVLPFEIKKASLALRIESRLEKFFSIGISCDEHRRTIDNPNTKSKPTTAAEHFLSSPNHTANDMQYSTPSKNSTYVVSVFASIFFFSFFF